MSNNLVKTNNFESTKQSLSDLKGSVPSIIDLPQFPTSGTIFRFNEHSVTGKEANEKLVKPLQTTIITLNSYVSNLLGFINDLYGLIDWLDNEYTKGIESAVNAAKISSNQALDASNQALDASNQALDASKKAESASDKATKAQEDIKRTIEALKITVGKLRGVL